MRAILMIHSLTGAASRDGSYESHFNDSFTDRNSVTRRCSQITKFEDKVEVKRGIKPT